MPVPTSVATNNQLAIVANRFNYVFNLKGLDAEARSNMKTYEHMLERWQLRLRHSLLVLSGGSGTKNPHADV